MTVSRAINGRPGVGPSFASGSSRRRPASATVPAGWRAGLASRKTSTLGIVLPDMANPFFAILAKAATDVARAFDKNVFIMNTDEDPSLELEALASLAGEAIDGVIVAGSRLPRRRPRRGRFELGRGRARQSRQRGPRDGRGERRRPGRAPSRPSPTSSATGRRRIGFIAGPGGLHERTTAPLRLSAGPRGRGLPFDPELVERCVPTLDGRRVGVRSLLARAGRRRCRARLQRPRGDRRDARPRGGGPFRSGRVAVIGADDVPYAALVRPALTTMRVDISALGRTRCRACSRSATGMSSNHFAIIRPELILRESA